MTDSLYSALKRRRCGRAITSESGRTCRAADGEAPAALPASPLRSEAANAAEEVLVLLVLIEVRFLSPPYSNCPGSTCLTHLGTEGINRQVCRVGGSQPPFVVLRRDNHWHPIVNRLHEFVRVSGQNGVSSQLLA